MKTPITYYGGKQGMLKDILPLIPEHNTYTEAFAGGAAGNILSLILSGVINLALSGQSVGVSGSLSFIPIWLILASLGFAVLVGMAAGYFPAVRAMKLSPLAAIRNE